MSRTPSAHKLRDLIANKIAEYLKAYDVENYCVGLGLPPAAPDESPFSSKRVYVRSRLMSKSPEELNSIAKRVAEEFDDEELKQVLDVAGQRGVDGELKNIIFASIGSKPRIVMRDAINNIIEVIEHADSCLIYDQPLDDPGLSWGQLTRWWQRKTGAEDAARALYSRLAQSLASPPERTLFRTYCKRYGDQGGDDLPALLPQVYLHYDPYTRAQRRRGPGEIKRERMDFLLLLPNRSRVVVEVDGAQHYATEDGVASPERYSEMMSEDRKIRLRGYEIYRFGGHELTQPTAPALLDEFFDEMLALHGFVLTATESD